MSEEIRNRTEIIADLVESRKQIYDLEQEIERLRGDIKSREIRELWALGEIERLSAVIRDEMEWLNSCFAADYQSRMNHAEFLERALK